MSFDNDCTVMQEVKLFRLNGWTIVVKQALVSYFLLYSVKGVGSSVGIATGYGLEDRVPVGSTIFILHIFQTGSGPPMSTASYFPGDKAAGA
jgi:uncharacterized protein involved in response to NO